MTAGPKSALVLFSGGQDSAVCLAWALRRFAEVRTVGFDYGQRHAAELTARLMVRQSMSTSFPFWASSLGVDRVFDLHSFGSIGESALTGERPIEIREDGLPTTFVPGRNLVFLTYAAAVAERGRLDVLVGGMGEADYSGYPDCRRATLDALETTLALGMGRDFPILTPLMRLNKAQTWALAKGLGGERLIEIIVEDSHTCYLDCRATAHPWGRGCGECPACLLRAKGFGDWVSAGRPALDP